MLINVYESPKYVSTEKLIKTNNVYVSLIYIYIQYLLSIVFMK